ncbi:exocyst complex component exo84 [Westerdykella ornata]|uniref:Exocyst complex component EXO84 n=1 Tax=Westerdykella ornata TaxID=318751 RepID=A0A6A6JBN6_WESOR|nr:exocyst complex component exo84 [Westerdykella ornata]KAF2273583.1 exocyst complex component exo84 [Westerdykella ornata]
MSEERSKGISLRKKRTQRIKGGAPASQRPTISGPVGLAPAQNSGRPSQESSRSARRPDAPRERPRGADRTAELVKKRYSQKITQLPSDFGNGAPMPSMPQIPSQYRMGPPSKEARSETADGRALELDMRALQDPKLEVNQYVSNLLADATESDIRRFQNDLRKAKNNTSHELQETMIRNRTQFIKISKEAEKLKGEMRTLRQLMSELTTTLAQTTSAAGANGDAMSARKAANRSSVANLEALWNSHLQELWKRVEGSQKYLPAIPGRHIVWESGKWVELNAATWKARRRVHLILLNDHLLVAAEKKTRADMPAQNNPREKKSIGKEWVAQRCWPLQDVQIADISSRTKPGGQESRGASNAVNIRVGSESFTFAVHQGDVTEKNSLLSTFRKALEDLRKSTEAGTDDRGRARDSVNYFAARDLNILKKTDLLQTISENAANNRASVFVDVDGKQQTIRSVENQLDDLDIDIALQRFEDAVPKVERLKTLAKNIRGNAMAQGLVTFKVNERAAKLANVLIKQLVENNSWTTTVQQHVTWIVKLGFEGRAREAYLEARSEVIRKRSRQVIFEGDLETYIFQLSFIYFTIIRNTVDIYQKCFPQVLMSACVKWAKEHVDDFNTLLARQLSSVEKEGPVWQKCMEQALEHAAMLGEVGLDFRELIGKSVDATQGGEGKPVGLGVTT